MTQKQKIQRDTLINLLATAATEYIIGRLTEEELQAVTKVAVAQIIKIYDRPSHHPYYITPEEVLL